MKCKICGEEIISNDDYKMVRLIISGTCQKCSKKTILEDKDIPKDRNLPYYILFILTMIILLLILV